MSVINSMLHKKSINSICISRDRLNSYRLFWLSILKIAIFGNVMYENESCPSPLSRLWWTAGSESEAAATSCTENKQESWLDVSTAPTVVAIQGNTAEIILQYCLLYVSETLETSQDAEGADTYELKPCQVQVTVSWRYKQRRMDGDQGILTLDTYWCVIWSVGRTLVALTLLPNNQLTDLPQVMLERKEAYVVSECLVFTWAHICCSLSVKFLHVYYLFM